MGESAKLRPDPGIAPLLVDLSCREAQAEDSEQEEEEDSEQRKNDDSDHSPDPVKHIMIIAPTKLIIHPERFRLPLAEFSLFPNYHPNCES